MDMVDQLPHCQPRPRKGSAARALDCLGRVGHRALWNHRSGSTSTL